MNDPSGESSNVFSSHENRSINSVYDSYFVLESNEMHHLMNVCK